MPRKPKLIEPLPETTFKEVVKRFLRYTPEISIVNKVKNRQAKKDTDKNKQIKKSLVALDNTDTKKT